MKSYSSVFAFIGIFTLLFLPLYQSSQQNNEDYLDIVTKSFQGLNAEFNELNIEGWAQISKKGFSQNELFAAYSQICQVLKINNNAVINSEYEDFLTLNDYQILEDGTIINLTLQSFLSSEGKSSTYLGAQIITSDFQKARQYYDVLASIFPSTSDIGVTAVGTYPGRLNQDKIYNEMARGFVQVDAQVIEGMSNELLTSFSGYTAQTPGYIEVDGNKLNINIALRYHSLDDKTYIHIGAPLIYQEY
ncbi:MAG: YwmB family TATA-box binding protein [Bacillota bacterium]